MSAKSLLLRVGAMCTVFTTAATATARFSTVRIRGVLGWTAATATARTATAVSATSIACTVRARAASVTTGRAAATATAIVTRATARVLTARDGRRRRQQPVHHSLQVSDYDLQGINCGVRSDNRGLGHCFMLRHPWGGCPRAVLRFGLLHRLICS